MSSSKLHAFRKYYGVNQCLSTKALFTEFVQYLLFDAPEKTPLPLTWVGFLGVHFEVGGGVKLPPCLKLVRVTLET